MPPLLPSRTHQGFFHWIRFESSLRHLKTPFLILTIMGSTISCTPRHIVSSPEGTVTSYVEDSGVLVYAPRSARAQKVVFDTPDQQLIHKPDTPFRKFFDSHAKDFGNKAKLEYAKTTILADIVNMVRNKEFIREMIQEVVDEHLDTAIAPSERLIQPLLIAQRALDLLSQQIPVLDATKQKDEILTAARDAATKVAKAADASCLDVDPRIAPTCENHNFFSEASAAIQNLEESYFVSSSTSNDVAKGIRKAIRMLLDLIADAGEGTLLPLSQIPAIDDSTLKIRQRNAKLLTDSIFLEFEEADYPNMRPDEVDQRMKKFTDGKVWKQTTNGVRFPAQDSLKQTPPSDNLYRHLVQVLHEQRYFRLIINKAVEKRKNLFFTKSSPVQPMQTAQARLTKFFTENVGPSLVGYAGKGNTSLWDAFLLHLNGPSNNTGSFVQPGTHLRLNQAEREKLSKILRNKLGDSVTAKSDLEKTMTTILQDPELEKYLRASDEKTLNPNDPRSLEQRQKVWVTKLNQDKSLKEAFSKLREAATKLHTANKEETKAKLEQDKAYAAHEEAKDNVIGPRGTEKIELFVDNKKKAHKKLESLLGTIQDVKYLHLLPSPPPSTPAQDTKELVKQGTAVHDLGEKACNGQDNDQVKKSLSLHQKILDSRTKLLDILKAPLDHDKLEVDKLNSAVAGLTSDYVKQSQEILHRLTQFQLKYSDIEAKVLTLQSDLLNLANHWGPGSTKNCTENDAEIWAKQLILNLGTHPPKKLAEDARTSNSTALTYVPSSTTSEPKSLFTAVVTTDSTLETRTATHKKKEKEFTKQKEAFGKTKVGTSDSFVELLAKVIEERNAKVEEVDRLGASHQKQINDHIDIILTDAEKGNGLDPKVELENLLTRALQIPLSRNVSASRGSVAKLFASTFRNQIKLISSDEPILKGFLEAGAITFNNPTFKQQAIELIVPAFNKAWKNAITPKSTKDGKGTNEQDTSKPQNPSVDLAIDLLKQILERPQIAYLFGDDGTTAPVVAAFKQELYNAFKHRVFEAVKAEQEADYSYWWLTFFPKAIPLGDQRLEGQSVIEVGFPKSITPEEQYHRWLQDQVGGLDFQENQEHQNEGGCKKESLSDGNSNKYRLWVQAATSVLNDFLIVLDSPELSQKYPNIRGVTNRAIAELTNFTVPSTCYKKAYDKAIRYLYQETIREWEKEPPKPFIAMENGDIKEGPSRRDGARYLATFSENFNCPAPPTEVLWKTLKEKDFNSCSQQDLRAVNDDNRIKAREDLRERAGNDFAWDRFGVAHILFAVTSAAETQETLPFKIELYANAFFNGSRRFARFHTREDSPAKRAYLTNRYKSFMQSQTEGTRESRLKDFLRLSGAEFNSFQIMQKINPKGELRLAASLKDAQDEVHLKTRELYHQIFKDLQPQTLEEAFSPFQEYPLTDQINRQLDETGNEC